MLDNACPVNCGLKHKSSNDHKKHLINSSRQILFETSHYAQSVAKKKKKQTKNKKPQPTPKKNPNETKTKNKTRQKQKHKPKKATLKLWITIMTLKKQVSVYVSTHNNVLL